MVLDFAALPPEINSGLMYTGAGAGPLMAAAGAWNNLAAELATTAASWESIVSTLTTEQWTGAGSSAAAAAAAPYVSWLSQTAAAAEQAASQATASAAAYEAAFTATVPPPVVAANRATLAALVATNFLGINTPAIAATEAHYAEMWVQDATAMYSYAASSATAGSLQPLTPASPTASPAASSTQGAAVAQAAAATPAQNAILDNLAALFSNPVSIGTGLFNALPADAQEILTAADGFIGTPLFFNGIQQIGVTASWFTGNAIPTIVSFNHTVAGMAASAATATTSNVTPLAGAAAAEGSLVNSVSGGGAAGALGEASAVGGLSVPASWSSATPATLASSTAPLEGSGWAVGEEAAGTGGIVPGMPGMAGAAKGTGAFAGPRYGVKPIVMPKPVVV
jgi:PPE-repeat protein